MKTGLVLEGGGMRCVYTVGVEDAFMKHHFLPDYLIGVSAGASNSVSYLSGQQGRGLRTNIDYIADKRYLSIGNYLKNGSLFGMDFIFKEIPENLDPFDYTAFQASPCEFRVGVTNIQTGCTEYFGKESMQNECTVLKASASLPVFSPPVLFQGKYYLDGGTSDPIPVEQALRDGCDRLIVVLTRDRSYQKKPQGFKAFYSLALRKYPEMVRLLARRHQIYNQTLLRIAELEREGIADVIAPEQPLPIDKFEKSREKLMQVYELGFAAGEHYLQRRGLLQA